MSNVYEYVGRGVLGSRPAATLLNYGMLYEATDDTPPTVYRSNGVTWDVYATVVEAPADIGAADAAHDHDADYSDITHDHDADYTPINTTYAHNHTAGAGDGGDLDGA